MIKHFIAGSLPSEVEADLRQEVPSISKIYSKYNQMRVQVLEEEIIVTQTANQYSEIITLNEELPHIINAIKEAVFV